MTAHAATVTAVTRKTCGLTRTVWAVRCSGCSWRAELRYENTALHLARLHGEGL